MNCLVAFNLVQAKAVEQQQQQASQANRQEKEKVNVPLLAI